MGGCSEFAGINVVANFPRCPDDGLEVDLFELNGLLACYAHALHVTFT